MQIIAQKHYTNSMCLFLAWDVPKEYLSAYSYTYSQYAFGMFQNHLSLKDLNLVFQSRKISQGKYRSAIEVL